MNKKYLKGIALMTTAQDEPIFGPLFIEYYRKWFDSKDIYVLDHYLDGKSKNQSIKDECNLVPWDYPVTFDEGARYDRINLLHIDLISKYNTIVHCDIDEFIVPNPEKFKGGLGQYLEVKVNKKQVRCRGYEVLHLQDEPAINLGNKPLLKQRKWWVPNPTYDKVVITRQPTVIIPGFHETSHTMQYYGANKVKTPFDNDLYLIHLKRLDYELAKERTMKLANRSDVASSYGLEGILSNFNGYFYEGLARCYAMPYGRDISHKVDLPIYKEEIPEVFKMLI